MISGLMEISNRRTENFCLPTSCSPNVVHVFEVNADSEYLLNTDLVKIG